MKTVIIGGVAAGASVAARLRRLDEAAEIVLLERGSDISYANCGLPYHLGGVIVARGALSVMSAKGFRDRFNVDVRPLNEAIAIDRAARTLTVRGPQGEYVETYDRLVIATGSSPVRLGQPGSDDPRIVPLWTLSDMDAIMARLKDGVQRVIVIGAGFVGLEVAENLAARNLEVSVVELAGQILPAYDREMTTPLAQELADMGIDLRLGRKVVTFESDHGDAGQIMAVLDNGEKLPAHLVVESVGVRPNSALAAAAGLELGPRGHIVVDASLRTSDPNIYAAGDVIEVEDPVLGGKTAVPLAGPANKQGRIVADNIAGGNSRYRGSYAASIIKIGRYALAAVGATERRLKQQAVAYLKIYSHPSSHATYYPGSTQMHAKLLFAPDGKILGVQCVGMDGADKRIDVIATAMQQNLLAPDLAWLELTYAPPFNSAKDPVNTLGMIADNVLTGKSDVIHADALPKDAILLDVRQPEEHTQGTLPGSINMPLPQLRNRLGELDKSRFYVTFCRVGMRGYLAERILKQSGFKAANLSGGFLTWQSVCPAPLVVKKKTQPTQVQPTDTADDEVLPVETLDVRGMACPGPIVNLKQAFDALKPNDQIKLLAETSFEPDLVKWSAGNGCTILHLTRENDHLEASLKKGEPGTSGNATMASSERRTAIVLFSNDLDKSIAAFIIACGMAASGAKTAIFFTFWGLTVLRKEHPPETKKDFVSKLFGRMLPKGPKGLKLSQLNMAGMGTAMMKDIMAQKNVSSLPDLIEQARALGVTFIACEMAMGIMGIKREELIAVDEVAGVASLAELSRGGNVLFI